MATPKLICKSAYISTQHYIDTLEYAGNKIDKQTIVYRDGSERVLADDKVFRLDEAESQQAKWVKIKFKEGHTRTISYERYLEIAADSKNIVRAANIVALQDDATSFDLSDGPHEMKDLDFYKYLSYIEGREGVEKVDDCGLFGLGGNTTIGDAKALAMEHDKSRKWSHIISMDTEDAIRTGFDNRAMWQQLIVSKAPEIAKAYNISINNLVIDCAYHGNTDNPHVHLLFYSKDKTDGFIKGGTEGMNEATEKLKSTLVNEIFKGETAELGKEKSALRKQATEQIKARMLEIDKAPVDDELQLKLEQLSVKLDTLSGNKGYGYLPAAVKLEVDELVQMAIADTPQLAATFEEYVAVQENLIARYVASPEKLTAKLEEWKQHFYHPRKSDMNQLHNKVIKAAQELGARRASTVRTYEGGNVDYVISEPTVSSPSFEDDAAEHDLPNDDLVDDTIERRTYEGGNVDYVISEPTVSSASFEDDVAEHDLPNDDLVDDTIERRTYEGKNVDYVISEPTVSSTDSPDDAAEHDLPNDDLTDDYTTQLVKRSKKAFRDSMFDIFNPKVANTALQDHTIEQLERLRISLLTKNRGDSALARSEIHRLLISTDAEYRSMMDGISRDISVQGKLESAKLNASLEAGTSFLFAGMDSYAKQLDDERYYQLLRVYKELGNPLNRVIRKSIRKCVSKNSEMQSALRNLADVAEYLDNKQCQGYAQRQIKNLQCMMQGDDAYNEALADYKQAFASVIHQHMPSGLDDTYTQRFNNTFDGVLRIMRPHYTYIQSARDLDKILCEDIMRSDAIQKPLKMLLRNELDACLLNAESLSSEWMRRELERIRQSDSPEAAARVLAYMYQTSDSFRAQVDNQIGAMYQLQKEVVPPEVAARYCDEYKEQLLHGSYLPAHGSVSWYAGQLDENYYRVLLRKHKDCFKGLNRDLYKGLQNALEDPSKVQELRELCTLLSSDEPDQDAVVKATKKMYAEILGEDTIATHIDAISDSFGTAIDGAVEPNLALTLCARVQSDVHKCQLPSVNFIIHNFAKELDEHYYHALLKTHKDCFKELNRDLYKGLQNALEDPSKVQELQALRTLLSSDVPDQDAVAKATQKMYTEILGEDAIALYSETIGDSFGTAIRGAVEPNLALTLCERVQSDVHNGDLPAANFILRNFSIEVDQNIATAFLKRQLKHDMIKTFRSEIFHAVARAHTKGAPFLPQLELLAMHANDPKNFDEILQLLSPENGDSFTDKKVALYTALFEQYHAEVSEPLDSVAFSKVMDSFFYGTDGNTLFLQEPVTNYDPTAFPFPTALIAKSLCKGLLRCVVSLAAQQQHAAGGRDGDHAFAKQKQFKPIHFPKTEQFTEY